MTFFQNTPYYADLMAGRPPTREAPLFGQRLSALRRQRGLSQQRLGELLGTTRANIAYYERSAKNPTLDFLHRCAEVFEVSVAELLGEAEAGTPRRRGPKSELEQRFEQVAKLPRSKQREILNVVDALLAQAT